MKFGIVVDDVLYEAPPDFLREVLPLLSVEQTDDLDEIYLTAKGFRRLRVKSSEPTKTKPRGARGE